MDTTSNLKIFSANIYLIIHECNPWGKNLQYWQNEIEIYIIFSNRTIQVHYISTQAIL